MDTLEEKVLVALRRTIRATDIHSRKLARETGLTTPQLVVVRAVARSQGPTVSEIARTVSLSQATATTLLNTLETKGLISRQRSEEDRRRVYVHLTDAGKALLETAPEPLQEQFSARFRSLESWEQHQLVSSLERLANMMDAEELDAAPLLATGEDVG